MAQNCTAKAEAWGEVPSSYLIGSILGKLESCQELSQLGIVFIFQNESKPSLLLSQNPLHYSIIT